MIVNEVKEKIKHALSYLKEYEGGYNFQEDDCVNTATNELNNALKIIDNLWHPASEKPQLRNGKCLVVYNSGKIDMFNISFVYEMLSNYGKDEMGWKYWAYVSDLFPKEGGEK